MEPVTGLKVWYKTWWGITIIAAICLLAAVILSLSALGYNYWRAIKSGHGDILEQQMNQQALNQIVESPEIQAARQELETDDDPFLGNQNASFVIVEFIDFKCPICKGQYSEMQKLINKYGYKIKWIIRDFPMESVHPGTNRLAAVASCVNEQGAFWLAHDLFFSNQEMIGENFSDTDVDVLINQFGLDKSRMSDCLQSRRGEIEVKKDYSIGVKYGIKKGTPTFFVNGNKIEGAMLFSTWETLLKDFKL
ncbi:MAG: hypothetical protein COU29_01140 [Candidatus Magasanikbacteria bacterium CG10_big_fil_rev_8_21_14_0_10_36_32]|uniref:Thioredoxin domain-containing protein n=1 Tax=Candidatus Magasanikbacteria bacterium CG10_big_fil_rev_8_21_14_0_10_36_32 TaxID=1974646 RepID=A0A2M6W6G1_9BACT|nr:MAG: hypothetical protein COU29_01140 [Candidatus Magasanikbacteria bacterium CG10_big_fil_rev_8_21_14_0_10_36_32]